MKCACCGRVIIEESYCLYCRVHQTRHLDSGQLTGESAELVSTLIKENQYLKQQIKMIKEYLYKDSPLNWDIEQIKFLINSVKG